MIEGERPSAGFWIAAVIGSALVMGFAIYRSGGYALSAGDLLLLAAIVCGGIGYTYSGHPVAAAVAIGFLVLGASLALRFAPKPKPAPVRNAVLNARRTPTGWVVEGDTRRF